MTTPADLIEEEDAECEICGAKLAPFTADLRTSNRYCCKEHEEEMEAKANWNNSIYAIEKAENNKNQ